MECLYCKEEIIWNANTDQGCHHILRQESPPHMFYNGMTGEFEEMGSSLRMTFYTDYWICDTCGKDILNKAGVPEYIGFKVDWGSKTMKFHFKQFSISIDFGHKKGTAPATILKRCYNKILKEIKGE